MDESKIDLISSELLLGKVLYLHTSGLRPLFNFSIPNLEQEYCQTNMPGKGMQKILLTKLFSCTAYFTTLWSIYHKQNLCFMPVKLNFKKKGNLFC